MIRTADAIVDAASTSKQLAKKLTSAQRAVDATVNAAIKMRESSLSIGSTKMELSILQRSSLKRSFLLRDKSLMNTSILISMRIGTILM